MIKKLINWLGLFFCLGLIPPITLAQASYDYTDDDGVGQTIQIHTRFHSFFGKPSWLLIIRDIDRGRVFPYVYDITRGDNFWLAFTYSRNYLITVSKMQFSTYRSRDNTFNKFLTKDFCSLESNGRILRNQSLYITIEGNLTPNSDDYTCHISSYTDTNFTIVTPNSAQ